MARISIQITESAELTVNVTDRMVSDYRECRRLARKENGDETDCRPCSLETSAELGFCLCEIPAVLEAIEQAEKVEL